MDNAENTYQNLLLLLHLSVSYKVMQSVPSSQLFSFSMKSFVCQGMINRNLVLKIFQSVYAL